MTDAPTSDQPLPERPATGNAFIDEALAEIDLSVGVHEHPEVIARALEAVQVALNQSRQPR